MKTLATYRHALLALACAVGALAFLGLVPEERLDKLALLVGALYERVTEEPTAAAAFVTFVVGALTTLRGAWVRTPAPAATPPAVLLRDDGEPEDDSDDEPPPSSDGPPTRPSRPAVRAPDRIERELTEKEQADALARIDGLIEWCRQEKRKQGWAGMMRDPYRPGARLGVLTWGVVLAIALTGCGASALRTHSTIATVARVSVVTAGEAIARTCEAALIRCTDAACVERTGADCRVAATAADAAIDGVRAYVDVIEVAARADEGQVSAALDLAVQTMARLYEALRTALASLPSLGVTLPPLPPIAIAVLRALTEAVTS